MMLTLGERFPQFSLQSVVSLTPGEEFKVITDVDHPGKWKVIFFWPMDFTFVCPTEITAFDNAAKAFAERNAVVLGVSTDTQYTHLGWRNSHPALRDLTIPMLADTKKDLCYDLGILTTDGVAMRATYIVDPEGIIRWVNVTDGKVGRSVGETLRVLDALQTDELCPCDWKKGDSTL